MERKGLPLTYTFQNVCEEKVYNFLKLKKEQHFTTTRSVTFITLYFWTTRRKTDLFLLLNKPCSVTKRSLNSLFPWFKNLFYGLGWGGRTTKVFYDVWVESQVFVNIKRQELLDYLSVSTIIKDVKCSISIWVFKDSLILVL